MGKIANAPTPLRQIVRTIRYVKAPRAQKYIMAQEPMANRDDVVTGPEIIPPGRAHERSARGGSGIWISIRTKGRGRAGYVATPGPFAIILALVALGILLTIVLLFLLGALLIWVPVFSLFLAALLLGGIVRGYFPRLR
jgi:hypothetical protein